MHHMMCHVISILEAAIIALAIHSSINQANDKLSVVKGTLSGIEILDLQCYARSIIGMEDNLFVWIILRKSQGVARHA